jgi:hypothetical protein
LEAAGGGIGVVEGEDCDVVFEFAGCGVEVAAAGWGLVFELSISASYKTVMDFRKEEPLNISQWGKY